MPSALTAEEQMSEKLKLPITLVLIDSIAHDLARESLLTSLALVEPEEVLIWTDKPQELRVPGASYRKYPAPDEGFKTYNAILWRQVPLTVHTSHFLIQQYDGWVINPSVWTPFFLAFDYIGATWPWITEGGNRVGNGGFSLRSTHLMRYLLAHRDEYPVRHPEDAQICELYRGALELNGGFHWADEGIADKFSVEHAAWDAQSPPFGFHDIRNWPKVLNGDELRHRLDLAERSEYVRNKPEYKQLKWLTMEKRR